VADEACIDRSMTAIVTGVVLLNRMPHDSRGGSMVPSMGAPRNGDDTTLTSAFVIA
jgi:hypothetical protein